MVFYYRRKVNHGICLLPPSCAGALHLQGQLPRRSPLLSCRLFPPLDAAASQLVLGYLTSIVTVSLNYALTYQQSTSGIYLNVYPQMKGLKL